MVDWLLSVPPLAVCLVVGVVVGLESLGVPLPGETFVVAAALLAAQDVVSPVAVAGAAAAGAAVGDSAGYALGRRYGERLLRASSRRFPRHLGPQRIGSAVRAMERHGAWAVFAGRFVALLRILAGPLAGTLAMPYRRFLLANVCGAVVWAAATVTVVVLLGTAAERLLREVAWGGVALATALVVGTLGVLRVRRARRTARSGPEPEGDPLQPRDPLQP
jgi:membrane protein DedA with SNARE-associated domain